MNLWHIEICDVTLRDGEQTPGVSFTSEEKANIATTLDQIGVEVIEAGFPVVSGAETENVTKIARMGLNARICCLARAKIGDVEAAIGCDVNMVSIFVATSDLHIIHKYKKPKEQVVSEAIEAVDFAHDHGVEVRFAAEDASRTDRAFLKEVFRQGADHGADLLSFADTVGCLTPLGMYEVMSDLVTSMDRPICAHCHNDLGCATANTITAAEAGAFQLHTTVNGIGERAGNAALEEVIAAATLKGGVDRYDLSHLTRLSHMVEEYSGIKMAKTKAVVGAHAFSHESGIHIAAILEDPSTYEYIPPELVGGVREFVLGKHSGKRALEYVITSLGYTLTEEQICHILDRVKKYGEHKCNITPGVLIDLIHREEEE